jgi:hypothetical protein
MKRAVLWVPIVAALLMVSIVVAQSGGGYDLSRSTIDGGGGSSSGGGYSLAGTIGQTHAGTLIGGSYTLNGGFWSGAVSQYKVLLPLTLKS